MDQTIQTIVIGIHEIWYQLLLQAPYLGYLGALGAGMAWRGSKRGQVLAVLLTGSSLLWHMKRTAALCLELTPNIRSSCKLICKTWLHKAERIHNVRVFDSFTQRTSRFLFEPNEDMWKKFEKKEVRTIMPDGSMETQSWFRAGKGLLTFTEASDLDPRQDVKAEAPYTYFRDDGSKAAVRVWTKTLNQSFKDVFVMEEIHEDKADQLLTGEELTAYKDFHRVLIHLLGSAARQGKILKCTQHQETINDDLSIAGQSQDVLKVLKEHPLTARHYFRCIVLGKTKGPGIQAILGFGKDLELKFYPTRIVLYIRHGTKRHACLQSYLKFATDTRKQTEMFCESEIIGKFGRFFIEGPLGRGARGEVHKIRALEGTYYNQEVTQSFALKRVFISEDEEDLQREHRIVQKLQHKFFVNIYEYCEIDLPEAARGILMELADTSLDKEVLKQATVTGKALDVQWLKECRNWMVQMVCAVRYMHGKCIVHRDLKPQNVLLVRTTGGLNANQKEIKLTDFGLSVEVQSPDQELHERVRTDDYFPHLAMPYTMKCDVFSLGRTFASILQRRKTDNEGNPVLDPVFDVERYPYPDPLHRLLLFMCKNFDSYRPSIDAVTSDAFFGQFDYNNKRFETLMEDSGWSP